MDTLKIRQVHTTINVLPRRYCKVSSSRAVNKIRIGFRIGSDRTPDGIGLVSSLFVLNYYFAKSSFNDNTGGWDFFSRTACVTNKKNRFSCVTRIKIHYQLENHRKDLFSTELHYTIFCCTTSYDYNSKTRLGHVTSLESKMAERDVSISHCTDFVFLSISTLI